MACQRNYDTRFADDVRWRMTWNTVRTTRQELYEAVWAEPVERVALRLGLSDVGLGKLCRRHNIPAPPRGYWARKAVEKADAIPPLPLSHDGRDVVVITKWSEPERGTPPEVQQLMAAESAQEAAIVVGPKRRLK